MAQRESTFFNMVACLFIITLVSGGILGFVHEKTKDAIELSKTKAQRDAIANVLPPFGELGKPVKVLPENSSDSIEIFPAYTDGKLVGMAVKTYSDKGFSGHISIMAGIDSLGNFTGYEVLEHKETPGLGSKMTQWFRNSEKPGRNIIGKNPATTRFRVKKDGGDIDAITASTITSRAFLDALTRANAGIEKFKTGNPGNNNQPSDKK
jgi:electron transport complex protein RnfG